MGGGIGRDGHGELITSFQEGNLWNNVGFDHNLQDTGDVSHESTLAEVWERLQEAERDGAAIALREGRPSASCAMRSRRTGGTAGVARANGGSLL